MALVLVLVLRPVLRLVPPRLAANLLSPQMLRDDGAVRMNRFPLNITHKQVICGADERFFILLKWPCKKGAATH